MIRKLLLRRNLLTILFVCILFPVVITLVQSATTILSQRDAMTRISNEYVQSLAAYAAERWNQGDMEQIAAFLALMADRGYDRVISKHSETSPPRRPFGDLKKLREKFIPGLVAYINLDGTMISYSQNAAILYHIFKQSPLTLKEGQVTRDGPVVSRFQIGGEYVTYVSYVSRTSDPRVFAVAAVTMLSWMGKNDFNFMRLAIAACLGMAICLVAVLLLRSSVIRPLQSLSSQVATLRWGQELPEDCDDVPERWERLNVEEITSLKKAVGDLARRMVEKEELEKRYVGDILKAQEDERGRIAQDIHDGPIQVVSALIQRIQMTNLDPGDMDPETKNRLLAVESVAEDLVEDLRNICDSLLPTWISLGLASCMEEAASRFARQYSITIDLEISPFIETTQEKTLTLFRIFQEAVSNAVRHGGATEIDAAICLLEDERLSFDICDNGKGFSVPDLPLKDLLREGKRGLNGMRQRVELNDGTFEIRSAPNQGTQIHIVL